MRTTTTSPARLGLLDGLRLLATFGIILYHYTARYPSQVENFGWLSHVTTYTAVAVYAFFIISGFVILMTAWGRDLPNFIGSRVGRLFPTYWAAVLLAGFIVLILRPDFPGEPWRDRDWSDWLLNFTMLQDAFDAENLDGVYWTLYMELKFYVLIGLFMLIGITRGRILTFVLAWPVLGAIAKSADNDLLIELLMPNYAPLFAIGMVLYLVYSDRRFQVDTAIALGFNVAFMLYRGQEVYAGFMTRTDAITAHGGIIAVILLVEVAAVWAFTCTRLQRVSWGWLPFAGALTYPLYLVHERLGWWVIEQLDGRGWSHWPAMLAALATVIVAALLLYRWIDRPLSRRMRQVVERRLREVPSIATKR